MLIEMIQFYCVVGRKLVKKWNLLGKKNIIASSDMKYLMHQIVGKRIVDSHSLKDCSL